MSREIDERVVQMKFESGQFEKNIQTSIHSLDELKKGMDFQDAVKGFDKLDKSAKSVDISVLGRAAEQVQVKFGMLEVFTLNVMNRISNAAIDTGERLVKSLTIDQITPGWDKYADKTVSVATIMSATAKQFTDTGVQMKFVNEQLDKLNWFTDETSYNFVDMVNNIGKFTSNNIELDKAVTAMQGIANWAAISGANAGEASRAMYNLSQAISSGSLKLQDWMSIENANMGTAAFKELAIQMGITAGTLVKAGDKITTANGKVEVSVESFRNTLSEGWLSGDVLMATLDQYGAATNKLNEIYEEHGILTSDIVSGIEDYTDGIKTAEEVADDWGISLEQTQKYLEEFSTESMQFGLKAFQAAQEAKTFADAINSVTDAVSTGWMKSFEIIFGDYEEAKVLWTDLANNLYDIFASGAKARNEMLSTWKSLGGRDVLIDSIWLGLADILAILNPIKTAWYEVFGEMSGLKLVNLTYRLHDFLEALYPSEETMRNISRTAKIFFSALSIGKTIVTSFASAVGQVLGHFLPLEEGLLGITGDFGDFMQSLDETIKETKIFDRVFGGLAQAIIQGGDLIGGALTFITSGFKDLTGIQDFSGLLTSLQSLIHNGFERFISVGQLFRSIVNGIVNVIKGAIPSTDELGEGITNLFSVLSNPFDAMSFEKALDLLNAGLFGGLILSLKKFIDYIGNLNFGKVFSNFKGLFQELGEALEPLQANLKAQALRSIAISILILAGALAVLASIDQEKLTGALGATVVLLGELMASMAGFDKLMSGGKIKGAMKISSMMIAMSAAILILSLAVKKLAELDWDGLAKGLSGVGVLCGELVTSIKLLTKNSDGEKIAKGAFNLILFAASIRVLVSCVERLSTLDLGGLVKGLAGVGVLMAELSVFLNKTNSALKFSQGISLLTLSASIVILTNAIRGLSELSVGGLTKGLVGLGVMFTELSLFMKSFGKNSYTLKTSAAILVLSAAIKSLSSSVLLFGQADPAQLAIGLMSMAVALTEITLAMRLLPKDTLAKSTGFIVFATAIGILSKALSSFGDMSTVAAGLVALGGSLIIINAAMKSMNGTIKGSAALVVFASGLLVLAPALKLLGSMPLGDIVKSLLMVAGVMGVLGGAAAILNPLIPAMYKLSAAIMLFSAAVAVLGAGVTLLSVGLASLGTSAVVGVGGLSVAILEIVNLIPNIVEAIGRGVVLFAQVIGEGAPIVAKAVMQLITETLKAISESAPEIVDLVMEIISKVIVAIAQRMPDLSDAGKMLFGGFSEGVASGIRDIVTSVAVLVPTIVASLKALGGAKGMEKGAGKSLVALIGVVASIGLLLVAFSHIPVGDVNNAVTIASGIAILMPVLAASFRILSNSNTKIGNKTIGQFAIVSAIAAALGLAIAEIGKIEGISNAITAAEAIDVLMPVLAGSFAILSKFSGNISMKTVGQFAIISAIAAALGVVIANLGSINGVENSVEVAKGIATLLVPLAGVVAILNGPLSKGANAAWGALGMLGAIVAALGAVAIGIGYLMQDPNFAKAIQDSGAGMIALGNAIGGFIGGIVGGLIGGVLSFLPMLGSYLGEFMANAQPFFDAASNLPPGIGDTVASLASAILSLTAAEILNGIANFATSIFGNKDAALKDKFKVFGEAISAFGDALSEDFDAEKVEAAANAAAALGALEKDLPKHGGKLQEWLGDANLGEFGEHVKLLGDGIKAFSDSVVGIDTDAVTAATNAGLALAELENSLPAQGGKLQEWLGTKDLGAFGDRLKTFGEKIVEFSTTVTGIDSDAVTAATNAGTMLSELENTLPEQGGILQSLIGSQSFENFGPGLTALGSGLLSFSTYAAGINVDACNSAAEVIQTLVDLEKNVDTSGGWGEIFTGKSDFSSFGTHIKSLGDALSAYSTSLEDINTVRMISVNSIVAEMLLNASKDASGMSAFALHLTAFKDSLSTYSDTAASIDLVKMEETRKAIEDLMRLSELADASAWINSIIAQSAVMISKVLSYVQSRYPDLKDAGEGIAYWLIQGVRLGVDHNLYVAEDAMTKLGNAIQEALEARMVISSPSAVMEEDGKWIVRGIAEGITNDTSAEDAIKKKADNIRSAFQDAMKESSVAAETASLRFQLWQLTDGKNASDTEVFEQQLKVHQADLDSLLESVRTQQAMADGLRQLYGEQSTEYKEAINDVLKTQIELMEKVDEVNEYQGSIDSAVGTSDRDRMKALAERTKEYTEIAELMGWTDEEARANAAAAEGFDLAGSKRYQQILDENREMFDFLEWSTEQIEAYAREQSGFTGFAAEEVKKGILDTAYYAEEAMKQQQVTIEQSVAQTTTNAIYSGIKTGVSQANQSLIPTVTDQGEEAGNWYSEGLANSFVSNDTINKIASGAERLGLQVDKWANGGLGNGSPSWKAFEAGEWYIQGLANGLERSTSVATNAVQYVTDQVQQPFSKLTPQLKSHAINAMKGFTQGVQQMGRIAIEAANSIASQVAETMAQALDINSPSRVTRAIGNSVGEGFGMGIIDKMAYVNQAGEDMADNAASSLAYAYQAIDDIIKSDDNFQPVITPVLDFNELKTQASQIGGIVGNRRSIDLSTSKLKVNGILADRSNLGRQNGSDDEASQTNYNFTQNNYSPKALNRVEIYRQTENQFARLKGATKK